MAYNTKPIVTDVDGNPISQYYNPETDAYEPLEGKVGANKVILYNSDGTENKDLSLKPILDKLRQLTGTVIDEETRKQNEVVREDNEQDRIKLYNDLLNELERIEQITEQVPEEVIIKINQIIDDIENDRYIDIETYDNIISLLDSVVDGKADISLKGLTTTNLVENGDFSDGISRWSFPLARFISIDNNTSKFVATKQWGQIRSSLFDIIGGNKYYLSIEAKSDYMVYLGIDGTAKPPRHSGDNSWQRLSTIYEPVNDTNQGSIGIIDSRAEEWTEIEVRNALYINLTQTFGAGNEPTKEECDQIFSTYFDGTNSTIGATRIKSVGKNLFNVQDVLKADNNKLYSKIEIKDGRNALVLNTSNKSFMTKFKPNTQYSFQVQCRKEKDGSPSGLLEIDYSDGTRGYALTPSSTSWVSIKNVSIAGKTIRSVKTSYATGGNPCYFDIDTFQIEEGTTPTPYEPYKEDISYILAKQDDKIVNLRSLPNGTKDEISLSEKKAIIKIGTKTDVVSGTVINYTDMADGGQFVAYYEDGTQQVGIKGDTLTATATTLIYQLAEPEIIPIESTGNVQTFKNGTMYFDNVVGELGFYSNGISTSITNLPIYEIDYISKVNKNTGYKEYLDVSLAQINDSKTGFTHPDLEDGDLVDWDYFYDPTMTTSPKKIISVPNNIRASINGLLDSERKNKVDKRIINTRLNNIRASINGLLDSERKNKVDKRIINTRLNNIEENYATKQYSKEYTDEQITLVTERMYFNKTRYVGHRGVADIAPENSIPSFEKAGELGFWATEGDFLITSDGFWVAHHDLTVDRMTDGTGNVSDKTLSQIKALTINSGANVGLYLELKIPTIHEYLDTCQKWGMVPIIEVKGNPTSSNIDDLLDILESRRLIGKAIISTYVKKDIVSMIRNKNNIIAIEHSPTSFSQEEVNFAKSIGNCIIALRSSEINESVMETCNKKSISVSAYTINDYNEANRLERLGVSHIYSDIIC